MRIRRTFLVPLFAVTAATVGAVLSAPTAEAAQVLEVSTAAQLKTALTSAAPGDTIHLADGTYTGNFKTRASTSAPPARTA